jgi:hypothetical protein
VETNIDWSTYLTLHCIFEAGEINKGQLIKFWLNYFSTSRFDKIDKETYFWLLENLVRGRDLEEPTYDTKQFAKAYIRMMETAGCINQEGNLDRN